MDVADSNRRVFTSSSRKLRRRFPGAINHVAARTMLYCDCALTFRELVLCGSIFFEPATLVNIRLEASVSHRLLAQATHRSANDSIVYFSNACCQRHPRRVSSRIDYSLSIGQSVIDRVRFLIDELTSSRVPNEHGGKIAGRRQKMPYSIHSTSFGHQSNAQPAAFARFCYRALF